MVDLKEGDTILKYGHDIGKVVKSIKKVSMFMFTM
jgi:(2R)-sulfolactate sulfo-lyase subunit alpha